MRKISRIFLENSQSYQGSEIDLILKQCFTLFQEIINLNDNVVIKPNWIAPSHKYDENEYLH